MGLTPWRRGPRLLWRHPMVALAVAAAAFVAALPAAAAGLFLSSSEHATLHRQIAEACPDDVGVRVVGSLGRTGSPQPGEVTGIERATARPAALADALPDRLAAPRTTFYGELDLATVTGDPLPGGQAGMTILGRDDAHDHVEVLAGPTGEGLWLPHRYAEEHGLEPGDELRVGLRAPEPAAWGDDAEPAAVTVPVAAIYRDLRDRADTTYWCGVRDVYRGPPGAEEDPGATVLPMALLPPATLLEVGEATRASIIADTAAPLRDPEPTTGVALRTSAEVEQLRRQVLDDTPALFPTAFGDTTEWTSSLGPATARAELVRVGLRPPVLPITAAGTAAGLAMVIASAVYWCRRRRRELTVLAVHGASPAQLGLKAVLEAGPAIAVGAAAGWLAAWQLVTTVGPSPVLAAGALPQALAVALAVGVLAVVVTGLVTATVTRSLTDQAPAARARRWWSRVPWELTLLAAAPVAWIRLDADQAGELTAGFGTVSHVPARLLVTPLLALLGGSLLLARFAAGGLRRGGLDHTPRRTAGLLAWRRVVRDAAAVAVLTAATAAPLAMAVFSATATESIRTTDDATLRLGIGAEAILTLDRDVGEVVLPDDLAATTTQVLRLSRQRLGGRVVDLLGVDPDGFGATAFWDDRLPGPSVADDLTRLTSDGTPTVIATAGLPRGDVDLTVRDTSATVSVSSARPLPGRRGGRELVVMHRDVLDRIIGERLLGREELWVAGDVDASVEAIAATGVGIARQDRVEDRRVGAIHEPVSFTFGYLTALSIFTGLIGATGLVLHLETRVATHRRGYVMLRRLGLSRRTHRRALLAEVAGPLTIGTVLGLTGATGAALAVRAGFDLDPGQPPGTILVLPGGLMAALAAVAVLVATTAAAAAQLRLDRADAAEVLRATD